ncbi:HNH endonuclease [Microbacterium oleivorans]|uniref:HNH endonuclease n=1 Tax=Microbacterium oleivorans TaxID=273677 RepID=A0A4R5YJX8_9MICO|nr:HNH endonuclease [Microbacterium oleivorans]TDL43594.1 HNH endonuclease [Microbacterium oleivorans]
MSVHSSRGAKWQSLRQSVLERDDFTCVYCGEVATTADHVLPKSRGGEDRLDNLVASCQPCNARKSDRLLTRSTWLNPRHFPSGSLW